MANYCTNCGQKLEGVTEYCPGCGEGIVTSNSRSTNKLEQVENNSMSDIKSLERSRSILADETDYVPEETCELCGAGQPIAHLFLTQRTGYIFARGYKQMSGEMCEACGKRLFKKVQLHNLLFSWWGVISFFLAPITLLENTFNYVNFKKKI